MTEWRALSLRPPWWWLMIHLPPEHRKDIENRPPGFSHKSFRGEFLIHSSDMSRAEYDGARETARLLGVPTSLLETMPSFEDMPRRGIVGRARIVDLIPPGDSGRRWHFPESFGFVVTDARPLPFVACKGALGFWRVPADVLGALELARVRPCPPP